MAWIIKLTQYVSNGYHQNAAMIVSYQSEKTGNIYFLMGHHSGAFMFPGGQVDQADSSGRTHARTLSHAAKRELKEETGIDLHQLGIQPTFVKTQTYQASSDGRYPKKEVHFFHAHLGRLDEKRIKQYQAIINNTHDDLQDVQFIQFNEIQKNENAHKIHPVVTCMNGQKRAINVVNYIEMMKIHKNIMSNQAQFTPNPHSSTPYFTPKNSASIRLSSRSQHNVASSIQGMHSISHYPRSQFFMSPQKGQYIGMILSIVSLVALISLSALGLAFFPYIAMAGAGLLVSVGLLNLRQLASEKSIFSMK